MYTIRPGMLVSCKTRVRGGVQYQREDLGSHQEGEAEISEWKTTRNISDKEELERAVKVRSQCIGLIRASQPRWW